MAEAASPSATSIRSVVRTHGEHTAIGTVGLWLGQANEVTGGKCSNDAIATMAAMAIDKYRHRSMEFIMLAIRDGMGSTDDDGKVYGSITWPKLALWLERKEQEVMDMAHSEHASVVVKNDNLDGRWLDEQERRDPSRMIAAKDREIDRLRRKLETKKP